METQMRTLARYPMVFAATVGLAIAYVPQASATWRHAELAGPTAHSQRAVAPWAISTIAGGVGGPGRATAIALSRPCGLAFAAGRAFIGQSTMVRTVDPATDLLSTPAGVGVKRLFPSVGLFSPDGTAASAANLDGACGVAADAGGDLALTAANSDQVQFVPVTTGTYFGQSMTGGGIYLIAGDGSFRYSGDGGLATKAGLGYPAGVALDGSGNLVIADESSSRIRVVAQSTATFYGQPMTAGDIYTVAGDGVRGFAGDGGPATSARLYLPAAVAVDGSGNLLVASGARLRLVAAATGTFYGQHMTAGDIYTIAGHATANPLGDGGPALAAGLLPVGIASDQAGNVVIADDFHHRVRLVAAATGTFYGQRMTAGDIYTIAGDGGNGFSGDGGAGTKARLSNPQAVQVDGAGNVLIADALNNRVRAVAAATGVDYGISTRAGRIYTVAGNGAPLFHDLETSSAQVGSGGYSGDNGQAMRAQLNFATVSAIRTDRFGNILIADTANNRVRVLASRSGTFYGRHITAGDIYTIAGDGSAAVTGARDGVRATRAAVAAPVGVAVGRAGSVLIAVAGQNRVRFVAEHTGRLYGRAVRAGDIYTLAGTGRDAGGGANGDGGPATKAALSDASGVAVDHRGNVLIDDTGDNEIRVVAEATGRSYGRPMIAGHIYKLAGGHAVAGGAPVQVAVDASGNVVIANVDGRIHVLAVRAGTFYGQRMRPGGLYSIAGGGLNFADGAAANAADLGHVTDVALDGQGNVLFSDAASCRVRIVAEGSGTFYGQPMLARHVYTIAGSGTCGYAGDGGPAVTAALCGPWTLAPAGPLYAQGYVGGPSGIAVTPNGDVVIGDCLRLREIIG
jgi:hypothetical protein